MFILSKYLIKNIVENPNEENVVYTYELVGSKNLKRTQKNNLFQKLEVMQKT